MVIDWTALAVEVGSIHPTGEQGSDLFTQRALAQIIGAENIANAVELILGFQPGSELAMNVLRYISSQEAAELAYQAYRHSSGEPAGRAVWLIKHIAYPHSLLWIEGFLRDDNVAGWGIGVLDQLFWTHRIDPEDAVVMALLDLAAQHQNENVREQAAFITTYLHERGYHTASE